ncbi:MAG: DUF2332 family protein [Pseudomonadota bacterium]
MSLAQAFRDQQAACSRLGSPFTARVLRILAEGWDTGSPLGRDFARYTGDPGPAGHSLPLRAAAALHALARDGAAPGLTQVYPPHEASDAALGRAIAEALIAHEDAILAFVQVPPQTNEVRRSAALIAMGHVAAGMFDRPMVLSEVGASGGLNLQWDRYALVAGKAHFGPKEAALTLAPAWEGPIPQGRTPRVADRAGVDLRPLDPRDAAQRARMLSYIWADQPDRMARTRAAAAIQDTPITAGDALPWLAERLDAAPPGHLHVIQNTVAWQYFSPAAQRDGTAMIEAAGARAKPDSPMAWMAMEADDTGAAGAAMTLRLWPGDIALHLGRIDFHGRWVRWTG